MAASWASLLPELLRLVLGRLEPRDLLAAACVCRSWSAVATSDALWLAPLAALLFSTPEKLQEERARVGHLGELRFRDLYILVPHVRHELYLRRQEKSPPFRLAWFAHFPWHPRRHTRVTLPNIWRNFLAVWESGTAFYLLAGQTLDYKGYSWMPDRCAKERRRRYAHQSFDRITNWTVRSIVASLGALAGGCAYAAHCTSFADTLSTYTVLTPLRLLLDGVPLGCLLAFLSNFVPRETTYLNVAVNVAFGLVTLGAALPHLWDQHIYWRLSLIPVLAAAACTYAFFSDKPRPMRLVHYKSPFLTGCSIAVGLLLWRVTLPTSVFVVSYFLALHTSWNFAAAGFSPFRAW